MQNIACVVELVDVLCKLVVVIPASDHGIVPSDDVVGGLVDESSYRSGLAICHVSL